MLIQAKYYDRSGAYVKLFRAGDIRQVPGSEKWRAYRMIMENVQDGARTVLEISDYRINQGVPDTYFTERHLLRGA